MVAVLVSFFLLVFLAAEAAIVPAVLVRLTDTMPVSTRCVTELQLFIDTHSVRKIVSDAKVNAIRYLMALQYLQHQLDFLAKEANAGGPPFLERPILLFDDSKIATGAEVKYCDDGVPGVVMDANVTVWQDNLAELIPVSADADCSQKAFQQFSSSLILVQTTQQQCEMCSSVRDYRQVVLECLKTEAYCKGHDSDQCEPVSSQLLNASSGLVVGAAVATALSLTLSGEAPYDMLNSAENTLFTPEDPPKPATAAAASKEDDEEVEEAVEEACEQVEDMLGAQTGFHLLSW
eukprot:Gregarina_sp_Poly_1__10869@NODE_845_length_6002_cov_108_680371_g610_i0_p3_GENE_NODE_845_length_6002_cov_108_680371_g610_i0NODE_845_length_6002_cov_108_680371_g610_i0_p3_ORF_typecomplete_len291_score55_01TraGD_C/PF12696_7/44TraGD_C/PF12696_7/2_3PEPutilisers_N/PF05524_13/96PEPutilisers_N/PF05524_13/1_2TnsD/PF15978_5/0_078TnsD/PF15978_5/3_9e03APG17/PF04108_12/99APG17/PF04108_12/2_8Spore_YtrH/PF14034_6/3_1Spore_YtrH/PF14034_6/3e02_NODE_845_length_6002_cov_108_680371_g610_i038764748